MPARPANFHCLRVRQWYEHLEDTRALESGSPADGSGLVKLAVAVAVANPNAGRFLDEFDEVIATSAALGAEFGRRFQRGLSQGKVESSGKEVLVGVNGEYEHGNAFLTTAFAHPIRAALGGAKAWIPSTDKRGASGASIDIPLAHKDAFYVRSHYDTLTVSFSDAPGPDEVLIEGRRRHSRPPSTPRWAAIIRIIGQEGLH